MRLLDRLSSLFGRRARAASGRRSITEKERRGLFNPPEPTATDRANNVMCSGQMPKEPPKMVIVRDPAGAGWDK